MISSKQQHDRDDAIERVGVIVDQIPEEILATISSYLDLKTIGYCMNVSNRWRLSILKHLRICYPYSQKKDVITFVSKEVLHLDSFRQVNKFWLGVNECVAIDLISKGKETFIGGSVHNLLERLIDAVNESEMSDSDLFELSMISSAVIGGFSGSLDFMSNQQRTSALNGSLQSNVSSPTPPGPLLGSPTGVGNMFTPGSPTNGDIDTSNETIIEAHSFQRTFFKTFESFMTKSNFLRMCFTHLIDLDNQQVEFKENEKRRKIIKLMQVLNMFVHYCIRMDPRDEENDDLIVMQLSQFLDTYLINSVSLEENNTNVLNSVKYIKGVQVKHHLYNKLVALEELRKKRQFKIVNPLSSSSLKPQDINREVNIYTIGQEALAAQLTILEMEHYRNLRSFEFVGFPWRKTPNKCPSIILNNKHFENVARWVANEIVQPKTVEERAKAFKFFIDICVNHLSSYQNFGTIFAISAGLMSASAFRLKLTRQEAGSEYEEKLENLREIVSLRANFRVLRGILDSLRSEACIPYLGMFLSDLKNLHDSSNQLRKYVEKSKELNEQGITCVNWFVIQREYQIVHQLMYWKQLFEDKYLNTLQKDEVIQLRLDQYLNQSKGFDELYQVSLKREPRNNN
ncbi:RasGEF domain-containing protein [Naegleria gruberi]|uniref:RasGEF domain-containing protein n=1 Tax=Naegleria gruberi TaxID=5762 RepID=D2V593_NAEGR|nr:RasGEF domain-containing protein [Naegleria gruberi]EFC48070.1 RasGEF domain-containing protein [Naegleria gruberi]|eukprot:XP_002680814.1 RasGEF domain-containing protein [Naegleria gruberi strain NEG-M]